MNLNQIRLPRELEADHTADTIIRVLSENTVRLWSRGDMEVPVITLNGALKKALQNAGNRRLIRCGFEAVSEKLEQERAGIAKITDLQDSNRINRISRLILFSNDGADRLYRHIEQLIKSHAPRLLGCMLAADSAVLGVLVNGRESRVKVALLEHKKIVSEILRAIAETD